MGYRVVCCLLIVLCAGCAPQPGMQTKASSDEWRLQNIEARFLEFQEAQKQREAELQSKVEDLDGQLSSVKQELDETKTKAGELQAETAAMREALRARHMAGASEAPVADMPKTEMAKPAAQQPEPPVADSAPAAAEKPMQAQAESATTGSAASAPTMEGDKAEQPMTASSPEATAMYESGLAAVRAGDAENGRNLLDKFIGEYPNNPLVPNALYWLGETYYHEKRYAQAVLTFKEVVRRFPKHDKSAAAMLKTGYAYELLGDKSNARFYLQTLVEDYPSTQPAEMARKRLASM